MELMQSYLNLLSSESPITTDQESFGNAILSGLSEMISGSNSNAAVLRESDETKSVLQLVKIERSRPNSLSLLQQMILSSGGDEDMTALMEMLHISKNADVQMKMQILKSIIACLKESHRTRAVFR